MAPKGAVTKLKYVATYIQLDPAIDMKQPSTSTSPLLHPAKHRSIPLSSIPHPSSMLRTNLRL